MRALAAVILALCCFVPASAGENLAGTWTGDWSGASGASGGLRIELERTAEGQWKCAVSFTLGGEEVKTRMKAVKVEDGKLEARYEFDLQGSTLESTLNGERKDKNLEGTYRTVAVPSGSAVDNGSWKASPKAPPAQ